MTVPNPAREMPLWELSAREHIRHTIAAYTSAGDGYRLDELAALFTPDGVLHVDGREPAVGRAAIAAMLDTAGGRALPSGLDADTFYVRHFIANVLIDDVTPESARATSYFAVATPAGFDHWGRYRDQFRRTDEGWLFAHRRVRVDARAAGLTSFLDG